MEEASTVLDFILIVWCLQTKHETKGSSS